MSVQHTNRMPRGAVQRPSNPDWQQQLQEYQQCTVEAVEQHPLAATLVAFGVGVCIGSTIGALIDDSHSRRRQHLASSLGRRMLDSLGDVFPDRIQRQFQS